MSYGIMTAFCMIIMIGSISILFIADARSQDNNLPEITDNFPIVRLKEIEQNADLQKDTIYIRNGVDWGNRISYDWSLLAPVQYEVSEPGIIRNESQEDQGDGYTPRMEMRYYRLRFSRMATGLVHDLMEKYHPDEKAVMTKIKSNFFDELFSASNGSQKQIYARRKNEVVYIDYYGNAEAEQIIALLAAAISPKGGTL